MTSNYQQLEWRQTAPGVWQRGIDDLERFYATMLLLFEGSGRMFFAITGHLSLDVKIPEGQSRTEAETLVDQALRKAWLTMRHEHPDLAARVTQNPDTQELTKTYKQPSDHADLETWLNSTVVPVATGQTGEEWANSDPPAPKLPTLFLVQPHQGTGSVRRDLVLRSPHDIIDGIGTLILFNNLITRASEAYAQGDSYQVPAVDGSETKNLSPPYPIAAQVPPHLTESQEKRLEEIRAQRAASASGHDVEVLALPFQHGATVPGRHQRVTLPFNKDETSSLLKACKKVGATPTHVFHVAAAVAAKDLQERPLEKKQVRYVNFILRNDRSHCLEPYSTKKYPAALYHSVSAENLTLDMTLLPVGVEPSDEERKEEFLVAVKTIRDFYHRIRDNKEQYLLSSRLLAAGIPPIPASPRPLPIPPPREYPSVSISSMGRTDTIVAPQQGPFRCYNPWVTGEELGNGLGLFLGAFEGEMCLSAAYNDAWHDRQSVSGYLECCKSIVAHGLGLFAEK